MTGEASHNPVLSGLTLAMFADSGWYFLFLFTLLLVFHLFCYFCYILITFVCRYMVNFSHAEPLVWGKGRGCDFFQKSCGEWPREGGYHCTSDSDSACTFDMLVCSLSSLHISFHLSFVFSFSLSPSLILCRQKEAATPIRLTIHCHSEINTSLLQKKVEVIRLQTIVRIPRRFSSNFHFLLLLCCSSLVFPPFFS